MMTGGRFKTDVVATLFFREAFVIRDFGIGAALAAIPRASVPGRSRPSCSTPTASGWASGAANSAP